MLKQPHRSTTNTRTQDGAGRVSIASAALRNASKQHAPDDAASKPRADVAPGGAPVAPPGAQSGGAKAFLEAAKRALDKAEYARVRASHASLDHVLHLTGRCDCSFRRCSRHLSRRR